MIGFRSTTAAAMLLLFASTADAHDTSKAQIIPLDDATWQQMNAAGAEMAVLSGDPATEGVYSMLIKVPQGMKIPIHTHSDTWRHSMILSGTLYLAFGDTWDEEALMPMPRGTFWVENPGEAHFAWARDGEVIALLTAMGPAGTTVLAPPPD